MEVGAEQSTPVSFYATQHPPEHLILPQTQTFMNFLRALLAIFILGLLTLMPVYAQQTFPALDASPADISYFREARNAPPVIKVLYGRPQKKGREIFGVLEPFGKVWRAGANESTEIRFYQEVTIDGKRIAARTYTLFVIPNAENWTIILNADTDTWGAYSYKPENDVLRVDVPVQHLDEVAEVFSIVFTKAEAEKTATMTMAWDQTKVELPISY